MRPTYTTTIKTDKFTDAVAQALDYAFTGVSTFEGWEKPIIPSDFGLGLILGPSGSGKTLLLKQFGKEMQPRWDSTKAIVSHFVSPTEAINRLMAVGLNSIPSWCRPFSVLSNGEQFRASLARKLENDAVIDEFTSVVDRNVAKAASVAVRRYIDVQGLKGLVFASCHYDILEWLRPDWYFDTATGILHDGRLLRRPAIKLRIYPCSRNLWSVFAKHHYLTASLNKSCHSYAITAQFDAEEILVGFVSSIAQPMAGNASGRTRKAYREHRTVVLPDFQGLGIGPKASDAIAQHYLAQGKRYFSKTAHMRFGGYRDRENSGWVRTCKNRLDRSDIEGKRKRIQAAKEAGTVIPGWEDYDGDSKRICFSHEYVGKGSYSEIGLCAAGPSQN